MLNKQRRAINVIKSALLGAGLGDRGISVVVHQETVASVNADYPTVAVFVSGPQGQEIEPFFETGATVVAAVKAMRHTIKAHNNNATRIVHTDVAPF